MPNVDVFLQNLPQPLPSNPVKRIQWIARELALGCIEEYWHKEMYQNPLIEIQNYLYSKGTTHATLSDDSYIRPLEYLDKYYKRRFEDRTSYYLSLLERFGYIDENYELAKSAFDLLEENEPYNIFISYKRSDSSAFALLVLERLKQQNFVPFVDMATKVGDNWYDELHNRIKECDYFIILLGRNTLKSDMTIQEIKWAIEYREQASTEYEKKIIPIWHRGFNVKHKKWNEVDQIVKDEISATNAIRVTDESASGYNTAIVELLNRFGVTP